MPKEKTGLPSQKELEKEISDYLSKKYGGQVKIISADLFPDEAKDDSSNRGGAPAVEHGFNFDLKPEELVAYLNEYVVCQYATKDVLATKICTHFNRIRYAEKHLDTERRNFGRIKSNVLLIGSTGVGKTFLVKLIAQRIGVPFVKGDATKFSETGYVGGDVEDLVRDLVREADGDIKRAQYGIIYVDEVDKIASSRNNLGHDVSRTGVQRALLKPMEETEVDLKVPHDPISQIEAMEYYRVKGKREKRAVNTKNILFIMSGAFDGLEEIIKKRTAQQTIGFEGTIKSGKKDCGLLAKVKAEDLIEYGFESEFVGRLPVITVLDELTEDNLFEILVNPNSSVIVGKKQDFKAYGIRIIFEDESLRTIAARAIKEKTGARALVSVMEKLLLPFEKKLPSTEVNCLVVNDHLVENPLEELAALIDSKERQQWHLQRYEVLAVEEIRRLSDFIKRTQSEYLADHQLAVTSARLKLMAEQCQRDNMDPHDVCEIFVTLVINIRACADDFSNRDLQVTFSEEAIDHILSRRPRSEEFVINLCHDILGKCEYGFKLLAQKKNIHQVEITAQGVDEPEKFINELVEKKFKAELSR
ncbi:MAG: AAA family ATPase [Proteobacteria bacterium]|nr:AAA family ATPase [Pseudomonadota bacterium]MBU1717346.1 AAA family ATPase [Pseudomonadota bacterium]